MFLSADIVFCFCYDDRVSSIILDLIIVLFRGNEEEGGKIHPMSEEQIIGDARWNWDMGSGAGNSCFRLIQISWAIQLALVGFTNPWTNPPFLDSDLSQDTEWRTKMRDVNLKLHMYTRPSCSLILTLGILIPWYFWSIKPGQDFPHARSINSIVLGRAQNLFIMGCGIVRNLLLLRSYQLMISEMQVFSRARVQCKIYLSSWHRSIMSHREKKYKLGRTFRNEKCVPTSNWARWCSQSSTLAERSVSFSRLNLEPLLDSKGLWVYLLGRLWQESNKFEAPMCCVVSSRQALEI